MTHGNRLWQAAVAETAAMQLLAHSSAKQGAVPEIPISTAGFRIFSVDFFPMLPRTHTVSLYSPLNGLLVTV